MNNKKCKPKIESQIEMRFYTPEEVQNILKLGRSSTYRIIEKACNNDNMFVVKRIGKQYRIDKISFDNWLDSL
ncbi:MAG: helix-turn-helix domain-containing protein [Eubacterium sp.]|nr:helix-turn-helix domain-containing protein [Eubacterium sp.]